MTAESGGGLWTARRWVRACRADTGVELATVVWRVDEPELIVVQPATGLLRASPDEAVAVAACLRVAAHGFPHLDESALVIEADSGQGWRPVLPES